MQQSVNINNSLEVNVGSYIECTLSSRSNEKTTGNYHVDLILQTTIKVNPKDHLSFHELFIQNVCNRLTRHSVIVDKTKQEEFRD